MWVLILLQELAHTLKPLISFFSSTMYCKPLNQNTLLKLAHVTLPKKYSKGDVRLQQRVHGRTPLLLLPLSLSLSACLPACLSACLSHANSPLKFC